MKFNLTYKAANGEQFTPALPVEIKPTSRSIKAWITRTMSKHETNARMHLSPAAWNAGVTLILSRSDNGVWIAKTRIAV